MTRDDQLKVIKQSMNITGEYLDGPLGAKLDDVRQRLVGFGVPESVVDSDTAIGVICTCVDDLYNYKKLSDYAHMCIANLVYEKEDVK